MMKSLRIMFLALTFAALSSGCTTQSKAEQSKTETQNEMMAKMHEQMASCLRSGKSPQECRSQRMKDCPMMKDGDCPMMHEMMGSEGMMGKNKMGQGMMKKNSTTNPESHEEHH